MSSAKSGLEADAKHTAAASTAATVLSTEASSAAAFQLHPEVKAVEAQLIAWRRYLHAHPELSFKEVETAKYIAAQLR
jgi:hypothetical protein